ncbi:thioredoxin-disulfide reductase [Halocella sp. SP3-1]|uniref:thioredoxin-disulfide reductase n=1 Tax=Halocella sp. SP3-1 TaxID=2382161 RepID=UPI000F753E1B|nr:thioredoxin-disulfide reductase [Halocella sp. SP3-1]AZO93697.1 thioredoxin-disulfide reductase [Halocella sp. SP3-1]
MSDKIKKEKLIIIGGGPAGLTAAIYGLRAGLDPLVLMGPEPGGQITTSPEIENFPGFPGGINGFELMQKVIQQVESFEGRLAYEMVDELNLKQKPYTIKTGNQVYQTDTIIIATGASPRKLGLVREGELLGQGVSYCATCDGAFFKGQAVAVVGGGDVALEEASYLSGFASKVYLIHRRNQFRGTKLLADRLISNPKLEILWNSEVRDLLGDEKLSGIVVENNKTNEKKVLNDVRGLFIAIGYNPNVSLFEGIIELDESGFIKTNDRYMTNIEGVFAAGDVQDPLYQQVVTSAGSGAAAAIEAGQYIDSLL